MLKTRIIPTLLFKETGLVKGQRFDAWRRVGSAMQAVKVYNMRQVDELIFLDIRASLDNNPPDFQTVDDLADECFMPMTVGGGVRTLEDIRRLLQVGADKIAINSAAVDNPALISQAANRFGSQCIVVSIDVKQKPDGGYEVHTHSGTRPTGLSPRDLASQAQQAGAGEILLTSIDRDGTMEGYDLELIHQISSLVSIPVIASGGASSYEDMHQALTQGGASAVAAASIFHFTQQTPLEAKHYLREKNIPVRL